MLWEVVLPFRRVLLVRLHSLLWYVYVINLVRHIAKQVNFLWEIGLHIVLLLASYLLMTVFIESVFNFL